MVVRGSLALFLGAALLCNTGCVLGVAATGITALGEIKSGVTGLFTDSDGKIIGVCCQTACVKAEKAEKFKGEFLTKLAEKFPTKAQQDKVASAITFHQEPNAACSQDAGIRFAVSYTLFNEEQTQDVYLSEADLGKNDESPSRVKLKELLELFGDKFDKGGDPKLNIYTKSCPQSQSISQAACSEKNDASEPLTSESQSVWGEDQDERYDACMTCTPHDGADRDVTIDWRGILS